MAFWRKALLPAGRRSPFCPITSTKQLQRPLEERNCTKSWTITRECPPNNHSHRRSNFLKSPASFPRDQLHHHGKEAKICRYHQGRDRERPRFCLAGASHPQQALLETRYLLPSLADTTTVRTSRQRFPSPRALRPRRKTEIRESGGTRLLKRTGLPRRLPSPTSCTKTFRTQRFRAIFSARTRLSPPLVLRRRPPSLKLGHPRATSQCISPRVEA